MGKLGSGMWIYTEVGVGGAGVCVLTYLEDREKVEGLIGQVVYRLSLRLGGTVAHKPRPDPKSCNTISQLPSPTSVLILITFPKCRPQLCVTCLYSASYAGKHWPYERSGQD